MPLVLLVFLSPCQLVPLLGHNSYHVRSWSSAVLSASPAAAPELRRALASPDLEIRRRSERALEALWRARLVAARAAVAARWPDLATAPCLDALWYSTRRRTYDPDMDPVTRFAYDALKGYLPPTFVGMDPGPNGVVYASYRRASLDAAADAHAVGVPLGCIEAVFAVMSRRDAVFLGTRAGAEDHGP